MTQSAMTRTKPAVARSWLALVALTLAQGACSETRRSAPDEPLSQSTAGLGVAPAAGAARVERVRPYPRGRWRLASPGDLSRTLVWMSHVLIRHRDVQVGKDVPFSLGDWTSLPLPPERSRDEALALARELQRRAASDPASFARLAEQYSEDVTTRERGGSLGGVEVVQLLAWGMLLDTLAALPQGQVSEVVETPFGFHVFLRRAPPPEQIVSGARIIIGHDDAPWLHQLLARRRVPARTRAEAEALAREIQAEAAAAPERFEELVERYSEHQDAIVRGDIGTWSTHEPNPYARELELLSQLEIGQVAGPIDTFTGFAIVRRTPNTTRAEYAAERIQISFEPGLEGEHPQSRAGAKKQMLALLQNLAEHPERFSEYQRRYCCSDVESWRDGRGEPLVAAAVARLRVGEQHPALIEAATSWSIVRRAELPAPLPLTPVAFEMPQPKTVDLGALIRQGVSVRAALKGLERVVAETSATLSLDAATAARLTELHEIEPALAADDARPYLTIATLFERVRVLLGSDGYERYQAGLNRYFEELILRGQP